MKCEVIIHWSEDDEAFTAEVPELPGCAADGQTHREALAPQRPWCRPELLPQLPSPARA